MILGPKPHLPSTFQDSSRKAPVFGASAELQGFGGARTGAYNWDLGFGSVFLLLGGGGFSPSANMEIPHSEGKFNCLDYLAWGLRLGLQVLGF